MNSNKKVIIIGSGAAGYTAAIYLARAGIKPVIISGDAVGGQLMLTTDVENYPGFEAILGPDLMEKMKSHAEKFGTEIVGDQIEQFSVSKNQDRTNHFNLVGRYDKYEADAVIIATGATAKWLSETNPNLTNEKKFLGYGVSGCATCDGFFFKNKIVSVIGGGNTAVEEALFLANHASKVYLIHRRDELRAEKIMQDKMRANPKIEFLFNYAVEDIVGIEQPQKKVTHVRLKSTVNDEIKDVATDGIFVAIGHRPNSELFKNIVKIDKDGYIITEGRTTLTGVDGLFACGDVQDKIYRQAVTAAGSGCMAALDAEKYLS
jgi:thioredoxin reductase (NADPH)